MNERSKKSSGIRYPLDIKKKALLELAESGDIEAVARHYNISKQTLYNWKFDLKRKNNKCESQQIQDSRHFQELLKLKGENAKLKERVGLLRDIVISLCKAKKKYFYRPTSGGEDISFCGHRLDKIKSATKGPRYVCLMET